MPAHRLDRPRLQLGPKRGGRLGYRFKPAGAGPEAATVKPLDITKLADAIEAGAELTADQRAAIAEALRELGKPTRYALIREAVGRFLTQETAPADKFSERLAEYQSGAWIRERGLAECPARRAGKLEGYLWQILKLRDCSISGRHVRRILDIPMSAASRDD
jgi:hypothetical protein